MITPCAWRGPGRSGKKDKNNGAVLFVFVQDHKMFLQVGYGLEGVLPDALCKRIIDEQISPRFKAGDFDGGLTAGVPSILAATKGEYKGTGRTVAESYSGSVSRRERVWGYFHRDFCIVLVMSVVNRLDNFSSLLFWGSGLSSGSSGGGGFGGGGFSSGGGGGGFSGGGGSFGGGGAGGSW